MKLFTTPIAQSPRGASSSEVSLLSRNVVADLTSLASLYEALKNKVELLGQRASTESSIHSRMVDGQRRSALVGAMAMASRDELEALAALVGLDAGQWPADRAFSYAYLPGMSHFELSLEGLTLEPSNGNSVYESQLSRGGVSLPVDARRSLVFGIDPVSRQMVFPEDLTVTFSSTMEGNPVAIRTTPPRMCLTDNADEPFARTVMLSPSEIRTRVQGTLSLTIPPSLGGSLRMNQIDLHPYPAHATAVLQIRLYSPSGALIETLPGPWSEPVVLDVSPKGPAGVGRVELDLIGGEPQFVEGFKTFVYGLAKLGFYEVHHADAGRFSAYFNVPDGRPVVSFLGLRNNVTGGEKTLVPTGRLRLRLQVPNGQVHQLPFGDDRGWNTVFDSSSHLDGFSLAGRGADWFPSGGIAAPSQITAFRVQGELYRTDAVRPLLSDLMVTYSQ